MNHNQLFNIAGGIWGLVGVMMILRGADMFKLAVEQQQVSDTALIIAIATSLIIGGAKGKFVFSKTARKNKERISALQTPLKFHQVYSPRFYLFIIGMMAFGFSLRSFNELIGGYVVVGAIYVGVGLALAVSSFYYWKPEPETVANPES